MRSYGGETADAAQSTRAARGAHRRLDKRHWLYLAVIVAVTLGLIVGLVGQASAPPGQQTKNFATALKPLGDIFVALIKMLIAPVIFCTIVTGVGSIAKARTIGKVGGLALAYFLAMSTFALSLGLVDGNLLHPGDDLVLQIAKPTKRESTGNGIFDFLIEIIPPGILVLPALFMVFQILPAIPST